MKLRWLQNIMISHVDDNYAIPSCLVILPESNEEKRLLEAFIAWRHSLENKQELNKREQS